jgi:hypothetical protein
MGATGVVDVFNRFVWGSFCGSGSFVTSLLLVVLGVIRYTLEEECVKLVVVLVVVLEDVPVPEDEGASLCFAVRVGDFF